MSNERDIQMISQSLDGQLSPEQDAAFKQRLLSEPELNRQYQTMKANDVKLKAAFATIDEKPLPQGLQQMLQPEQSKASNVRYLALAASVLAVSVLSYFGIQNSPSSQMDPTLVAALDSTPTMVRSDLNEQTAFIVNESFFNKDGRFCRVYLTQDSAIKSRAVACKNKSRQWQIEAKEQTVLTQNDQFVTASDEDKNVSVDAYLDKHKQGNALSELEEAEHISK